MKIFLVLFRCEENSKNHRDWMNLSPKDKENRLILGNKAIETWKERYGDKIKYNGSSLDDKTIAINSNGLHEVPSTIGKFIIVEAQSQPEAAKMFLDHPHFAIFPGDGVDVLELVENRFE